MVIGFISWISMLFRNLMWLLWDLRLFWDHWFHQWKRQSPPCLLFCETFPLCVKKPDCHIRR